MSKRTRGRPEQPCQDPHHRPVHNQALGEGPWDEARSLSRRDLGRGARTWGPAHLQD